MHDSAAAASESATAASFPSHSLRGNAVALAAIAVAVWFAYWPCLWGGFIWDDNSYVRDNVLLHTAGGLWRIWFDFEATSQYHPLVFSTFWIEYQLWGLDTLGYHVVNVALHTANSLLLWAVLQRLRVPGSVLAAALFALHPVHVESVAWISERKDVLSAFFYALTMLAWLRFLDTRRERDWLIALALAACTLLSKTVLCTLPAAMALLAAWKAPAERRQWVLRLVPFLLLALVMAAVTVWREHDQANAPLAYTLLERSLIASRALWTYVVTLLWPIDLTIIYEPWEVSNASGSAYLFPLGGIGVLVALLAWRQRLGSAPLVAVLFFLITLAPMLGFVDYNIMRFAFVTDHFQYVASAGLLALAAAGAARWTERLPNEQRNAIAVVPLFILTLLCWRQAGLYTDAETMWRDNLVKNPRSWTGYSNLAGALARNNQPQEAIAALRKSVEINPQYAGGHNHLGILLAGAGQTDEAIAAFRAGMQADPTRGDVANNLGTVLISLGRIDEAADAFAAAVKAKPDYAEGWRHWAIAAARLGRREEAIAHLQEALRLRPDFAAARADLERLQAAGDTN